MGVGASGAVLDNGGGSVNETEEGDVQVMAVTGHYLLPYERWLADRRREDCG